MSTRTLDDLVKHIQDGKPLDLEQALRAEKAAREKLDNEAVIMQLLVARMEKSIGAKVDQKILIGSLITILAKTISHSPVEKWERILFDFMQATAGVLESVRLQFEARQKASGKPESTTALVKEEVREEVTREGQPEVVSTIEATAANKQESNDNG